LAEEPETTFKIDVKLVNVFVTVTDGRGAPVANLQKENFVLQETAKSRRSRSLTRSRRCLCRLRWPWIRAWYQKRSAAGACFGAQVCTHNCAAAGRLAVYKFSEEVSLMVPFTSDLKKIDAAIDKMHNGAATALYDAIYLGSHALSRRQGRKVMVVITDGGDTMSQVNYKEALRAARRRKRLFIASSLYRSKPTRDATRAANMR